MKKILYIIIAAYLLSILSSCQPNPNDPIVISKNDGMLEKAIYSTPAPLGHYDAPDTWQEEINTSKSSDKLLTISVDAKIKIPNVEAYPVYRATPRDITEDDAKKFIKAVTGSSELYSVKNWRTKDIVKDEILYWQNMLDDENSSYNKAIKEHELTEEALKIEHNQMITRLNDLKKEYKSAPTERDVKQKSIEYAVRRYGNSQIKEISGVTEDTKSCIYISKDNSDGYGVAMCQNKQYYRDYLDKNGEYSYPNRDHEYGISRKSENLNDIKKSSEEALADANKYVHETLGYADYEVVFSGSTRYIPAEIMPEEWVDRELSDYSERYYYIYTKTVGGIPICYYSNALSADAMYAAAWPQNILTITVDDKGIYCVNEISSIQTADELTSNVSLLPFDKVQSIFRKYIVMNIDYDESHLVSELVAIDNPYKVNVNINDIRLGYLRLRERGGSSTDGLLIPVWMFYGQQFNYYKSQTQTYWQLDDQNRRICDNEIGRCYLCINAVDGSIIDLTQGY